LETFSGRRHCGRVRFEITGDLAETLERNCSICRKKGFLHLIVPPERFALLSGAEALSTYRFNTGGRQRALPGWHRPDACKADPVRRVALGAGAGGSRPASPT
jgi:hypothetical protein